MKHPDPDFLAPYLDTLEKLGVRATAADPVLIGGVLPDASLQLHGPRGRTVWACELKVRIEPGTLGPVVHRMKVLRATTQRALLLTEHVTTNVAMALRDQDVHFVDAAGNAFLRDDGMYVWAIGARPHKARGREPRGLHAAGVKLLFALLQRERPTMTQRQLADEAGIALGGVGRILVELERRNWVRKTGPNVVTLHDAPAMLKRWDEGYADTLRPKLFVRACRRGKTAEMTELAERVARVALPEPILIGGELGAALLTQRLKPVTAALHVPKGMEIEVMRKLDLLPDKAGDVRLIHTFGSGNANDGGDLNVRTADPLLVRAELLVQPDDRLREIAETLRTQYIEPRWK